MYIIIVSVALLVIVYMVIIRQPQFGRLPQGDRQERIESSPNFRDGEFRNLRRTVTFTGDGNRFRVFSNMLFKKRTESLRPEGVLPVVKTDLNMLSPHQDFLVWLGHSGYFMQIEGKTILVDPVLNSHASPFRWIVKAFEGTQLYNPEQIPDIEYLVITHDHWDHLDYTTVRALRDRISTVICGLGVGAHLERWGFDAENIVELDWHESAALDNSWTITATPARHFSGRGMKRNRALWSSFVLKAGDLNLFIGGDGGYGDHFAGIGKEYGPFDLAILEQGQYNENWKHIHLMPEELFRTADDLKAQRVLPVHNSRFALSNHPWNEPFNLLKQNGKEYKHISAITPMIGEVVNLRDTSQTFIEWWK